MIRNELVIYFTQQSFWGGDEVKGYAELRCPLGLKTQGGVIMELYCCEIVKYKGQHNQNFLFKKICTLEGPCSKPDKTNKIIKGITKFFTTEKPESLPIGNHKYPFAMKLPNRCPPSYKYNRDATVLQILYQVKITVKTPKGVTPLTQIADVNVNGTLFDLNFIGNYSAPLAIVDNKTFTFAKGVMKTTVTLPTSVFPSGSSVKGEIYFENASSKATNNTVVKLKQTVTFLASGTVQKHDVIIAQSQMKGVDKKTKLKLPFELKLPLNTPESIFGVTLTDCKPQKLIKVGYQLILDGEISMATDLAMVINFFVATPNTQSSLIQKAQSKSGGSNIISSSQPSYNPNVIGTNVGGKTVILPPPPTITQFQPDQIMTQPNTQQQQLGINPELANENQIPSENITYPEIQYPHL